MSLFYFQLVQFVSISIKSENINNNDTSSIKIAIEMCLVIVIRKEYELDSALNFKIVQIWIARDETRKIRRDETRVKLFVFKSISIAKLQA